MHAPPWGRAAALALAVSAGCFSPSLSSDAPDVVSAPSTCRIDSDCGDGRYCGADRLCTRDCREDRDCEAAALGSRCDRRAGRCVASSDAGASVDAATGDVLRDVGLDPTATDAARPGADVLAADVVMASDGPASSCVGLGCDEFSPGPDPESCSDCGGTGETWGRAMYAWRGVCAYSNGPTASTPTCAAEGEARVTADGQVPYRCERVDSIRSWRTTIGGAEGRRGSWAFQCVEYARRGLTSIAPGYNPESVAGNACQWWVNAAHLARRYQNGVESGPTAADAPPAEGDLLVFRKTDARGVVLPCGSSGSLVGHIAVVAQVDLVNRRVWIAEENFNVAPRALTLTGPAPGTTAPWRVADASGYHAVGWMRFAAARPQECGVRLVTRSVGAAEEMARYSQLVTCGRSEFCDVNAGRCRPVVPGAASCAEDPGVCVDGTRCDGARCVCDDAVLTTAAGFRFDVSTRCWRPGPFVANADGCSASIGLREDGEGRASLYARDLDARDPMLISPRVSLVARADHRFEVVASCRGLAGTTTRSQMRIYLARAGDSPQFDPASGGFALAAQPITCDGSVQTLRFDLAGSTVPEGVTLGRVRLDPLDGSEGYERAEVWIRSVEYRGAATGCAADTCTGHGTCSGGLCECDPRFAGARCDRCAAGFESYPACTPVTPSCVGVTCPECSACVAGRCEPMSDGARCAADGDRCTDEVCRAGRCEHAPIANDCGGRVCGRSASGCFSCGADCGAGAVCSEGACVSTCRSDEAYCSGACVNVSTSSSHCGRCGNACAIGQSCVAGSCQCLAGQRSCGGVCVDTSANNSHCGSCNSACAAGAACQGGACVSSCGSVGRPCCAGSVCDSGLFCIGGACQGDTTPGQAVYRFADVCTSAHWHSTSNCYPLTSSPTLGCGCATRVTNASCSAATCWRRESSFNVAAANPGYGSFFQVHHCFSGGANTYSRSPCAGGTAGDPATLGWMASSPIGFYTRAIYLCQWRAGAVIEQFFTAAASECAEARGTIVSGAPFGYAN